MTPAALTLLDVSTSQLGSIAGLRAWNGSVYLPLPPQIDVDPIDWANLLGNLEEEYENQTRFWMNGRVAEFSIREFLVTTFQATILAEQLRVKTAGGIRILDYVVSVPGFGIEGVEVKYNTATRSNRQLLLDGFIATIGAEVSSWNSPAFPHGSPVRMPVVEIKVRCPPCG
jgi:hypothetical protein